MRRRWLQKSRWGQVNVDQRMAPARSGFLRSLFNFLSSQVANSSIVGHVALAHGAPGAAVRLAIGRSLSHSVVDGEGDLRRRVTAPAERGGIGHFGDEAGGNAIAIRLSAAS